MQAVALKMRQPEQEHQQHLNAEQILELVELGRRSRHYAEYIDHITVCSTCRETYRQLLQAEQTVRTARRAAAATRLRIWLPAAAAATLVLLFGASALLGGVKTAGLRQEGGVWYEGATRLPEWAFSAAAQFAHPPAPIREARSPSPAIRLISPNPANAAVEGLAPEFGWHSVPDTVRYRAWLERTDSLQRIRLIVKGTRAVLPQGEQLDAGVHYRLVIEALAADERAGDGLRATFEFRTLLPSEQRQLRWARENRSKAPRVCSVIFYQLGFYADALETLNTLPNEPQIAQWRAALASRAQGSAD